jgi:hypothetical protein
MLYVRKQPRIFIFFNFEKTNAGDPTSIPLGPGPAPAQSLGRPVSSPYVSQKSFTPLSSPFTCWDRVSRRGCVQRRREDGAAAQRWRGCIGRREKGWRDCDEEAAQLRRAARGGTTQLLGGRAARLLGSWARQRGRPPLHLGLRRPRVLASSPTTRFSTTPSHQYQCTTIAPPLSIAAIALRRGHRAFTTMTTKAPHPPGSCAGQELHQVPFLHLICFTLLNIWMLMSHAHHLFVKMLIESVALDYLQYLQWLDSVHCNVLHNWNFFCSHGISKYESKL